MQHMKRRPDTATNKSYSELHLPGVSKTPPADGPVLSRKIYLTKVLPLLPDHREGGGNCLLLLSHASMPSTLHEANCVPVVCLALVGFSCFWSLQNHSERLVHTASS